AGDAAELQKVIEVTFTNCLSTADGLVKKRLGEGRLVRLVVAESSIAVHVDEDVALELGTEIEGDPHAQGNRIRILAVHVKDRGLQHLGDIRGIGAGAA